jgi:phosphatidate cytidylyltransferase
MALKQRLVSGILLGGGALASLLLLPSYVVPFILVGLALWVMLEFYSLLDASNIPHFKVVGTIGGVLLVLFTWLTKAGKIPASIGQETNLLFLIFAACFLRQLFYIGKERAWETTAGTLLGVVYGAFLLNFMTKMMLEWGEAQGRYLLLMLVVSVKLTDVGAYFTGCSIGKHKLIPRISPGKTWEGCVGGVVLGTFGALTVSHFFNGRSGVEVFNIWQTAIVGLVLAISGILGDLIESLFKRAAGVKDSGGAIRGMGGILDVLDSLLFTAPVLYILAHVLH